MKNYTKLTFEEMIRRKEQILESKKKKATEELYIESLGGTITITEPDRGTVIDSREMDDAAEADAYFLLQVVTEPPLQRLAKEYGCAEPTEIVDIIFKGGEVGAISKKALELAGYNDEAVKPIKEIKN